MTEPELIARYKPHRRKVAKLEQPSTETVRTYDRDRAPKGATAGEDVYPAAWRVTPQGDGSFIQEPIPERRVPWWEYDETTTRYVGPQECTDCGGGLASLGDAMICMRLRATVEPDARSIRVPGSGGVIECGVTYVEVDQDG